ncbi:SGNH/GDSL hydrolase family protein [Mucilaginibacter sp. OK098]|uniref:SGNH/GDSL hydrolase family protein n=1 Tax=Mucilaginibacter sp. OK098 TaxID=1855297 RepID=UPI0009150EAF|nr:SGNH/GDSL hydrolase family protein [Mucilaginibacter sp. OK098]SHL95123.1 Lysophospholipase L1 [Mucilaginibacter sp. OK098]
MNNRFWFFLIGVLISLNCAAQTVIKNNDPHIRYSGRIAMRDTAAELSWSANSIKINFTGTGVSATLKDERSDNNYNVIVDGKVVSILHPEMAKKDYVLAFGLPAGKHTLELFKRTEWAMGKTWFYQFKLNNGGKILAPPPAQKHKIEYFGDSITCGYADEDTTGQDRGTSPYENGYISYAALTARHYNAEFYNTSKSGIGITISWFPLVMPEMYDRLDATDPKSKWDFSKYTPELVIINLFQNDSWLVNMHDNEQFKAKFGTTAPADDFIINAYRGFVKSVRAKYPKAQILCILGSMDATKTGSPWPGYIDKAVTALNDKRIHTHFIPYKNTNGHPSAKEQQAMADDLIAYIDKTIGW